jgi:hypothetical protein
MDLFIHPEAGSLYIILPETALDSSTPCLPIRFSGTFGAWYLGCRRKY